MNVHSTPSEIGARAEAAIARALIMDGKQVYIPLFSAHARADLVFEDVGGLHRVQCKTSRVIGDVVWFRVCSNTNNEPRDYRGQIDFFGVFSPELDEVYWCPLLTFLCVPRTCGWRRPATASARASAGLSTTASARRNAQRTTLGSRRGHPAAAPPRSPWRPGRRPGAGRALATLLGHPDATAVVR